MRAAAPLLTSSPTAPLASPTPRLLSAAAVQTVLADGGEIALLDVREAGQFGEGHAFFAVPLPYSRLELDVRRLVPRLATRIVLVDGGDGVADRAARRLAALGYTQVAVQDGGAPAWAQAGFTLFKGVNLPSKTFGELVEHAFDVPHLSAQEVRRRQAAGEPLVLLDGRTFEEHRRMAVPGAVSVPNGELALAWRGLVPDATTPVVVHCAGRTRSIVGAQILRELGLPNPVYALENGTQGWALAGLPLEHGSTRRHARPDQPHANDVAAARRLADAAGVQRLTAAQAQAWLDDDARTTHVLDVRSAEEFSAGSLAGATHAPGGQLLQATDQFIGLRGGRVLLLDAEDVRAPVAAAWLARLGFETAVVEGGIRAPLRVAPVQAALPPAPARVAGPSLTTLLADARPLRLDLQPSLAYRRRHAEGAQWSIRPRVAEDAARAAHALAAPVLLLADDAGSAALAAQELREAGRTDLHWTTLADWEAAGLPTAASPGDPGDAQAIDHLWFVHDRHDGNLDAARAYLAWETGLIAQTSATERAVFRLPADTGAATSAARLRARRQVAVRETLDTIRALLAGAAPDRDALARVAAQLEALAAQRDLFPDAEFPPPPASAGTGGSTRYRLNAGDDDDDLALYLNALNPGRSSIPHNHTTWAVIVALHGEEENRLWKRLDDGSDPAVARIELAREVTVRPGTSVAFLPDDLHSIHVTGSRPTLHFHLYGRPLETLTGRIGIEPDTGRIVNYNKTQMRPSRVAA